MIQNGRELTPEVDWNEILTKVVRLDAAGGKKYGEVLLSKTIAPRVGSIATNMDLIK